MTDVGAYLPAPTCLGVPRTGPLGRRLVIGLGLSACLALGGPSVASAATLRVTSTSDALTPRDGKCSLREAIAAANSPGRHTACGTAGHGANTIVLRAARYTLSHAAVGGDDNSSGDLDVRSATPLTITGAGTNATVISAGGLGDRVLSVGPAARLTLNRVRITGGHPSDAPPGVPGLNSVGCTAGGAGGHGYDVGSDGDGGGINNAGTLRLNTVAVIGYAAGAGGAGGAGGTETASAGCAAGNGGQGGDGGGIYNQGILELSASTIAGNTAGTGGTGGAGGGGSGGAGGPGGVGGPGGNGGGIYNQGELSVIASALYGNRAGAGGTGGQAGAGAQAGADGTGGSGSSGGGIFSTGGPLEVKNSTLATNFAGPGGAGGGSASPGGSGGSGGGIAVLTGESLVRNATLAGNGVGAGGSRGSQGGPAGPSGRGGGLFVQSFTAADSMRLQNTIVASSRGSGCAGNDTTAIANGGHDLSYGDRTCPGANGNPHLGSLSYNGGPTPTLALSRKSAARGRVPGRRGHCPARDQRGVLRAGGGGCDIGAYEFAIPTITILSPAPHGSYHRGSRVVVRFRCTEGGVASVIVQCHGSLPPGRRIRMGHVGGGRFSVTATDKSGHRIRRTVRYSIWEYVNPLRAIRGLRRERIDMGVDYGGAGPLLALGRGRVTVASNHAPPSRCRGITCWIGGGAVIYRLLDGPFAGRSVYLAENITVTARVGQIVRAGQRIAILHPAQPQLETGWASNREPQPLAMADGHECQCGDPGGWSTIEGRNFNRLLVRLGAPSGRLQPGAPDQRMPRGWPSWR